MSCKHNKSRLPNRKPAFLLEGAVAHAARGRNGRQEGCERGYYHLHRNLNNPLLHNSSLYTRLSVRIIIIIFAFAGVDDQRTGLAGHSKATGVDTVVFGELDF